jgi:hypothetical protein
MFPIANLTSSVFQTLIILVNDFYLCIRMKFIGEVVDQSNPIYFLNRFD